MYTTNQRADVFGSINEAGDFWDSPYWGGWSSDYFLQVIADGYFWYYEEDSLTPYVAYIIQKDYTIPYAINATATLYEVFGERVGSLGAAVPLPTAMLLLGSGLVALAGIRMKLKKR